MTSLPRLTSTDLEVMPEDNNRYEVIDGELYMTRQPHFNHQLICGQLYFVLQKWNVETKMGKAIIAPGIIFAEDDDVAPDVVWISKERLNVSLEEDGKLHNAPDIAIEVLSPGLNNERRDRDTKLKLYSRRGVGEYWIIDWRLREIEVYRRQNGVLSLEMVLKESDTLQSPLLAGFLCPLAEIFMILDQL